MAPKVNTKSDRPKLLLTEGINDGHVVHHLVWLTKNTDPIFGLYQCGSDDQALDELAARMVTSETKQTVLGIMLDSDIDGVKEGEVVTARYQQIKSRAEAYYDFPETFPETGLILNPKNDAAGGPFPRLGVWLMPDNKSLGMLEDLLVQALGKETRDYTSGIVQKAKADQIASFQDMHLSKAVIRTYLAWQDPPDNPFVGIAIRQRVFPELGSTCAMFINWLDELFD